MQVWLIAQLRVLQVAMLWTADSQPMSLEIKCLESLGSSSLCKTCNS